MRFLTSSCTSVSPSDILSTSPPFAPTTTATPAAVLLLFSEAADGPFFEFSFPAFVLSLSW